MRILVHDYSGHPFQAQLSRALAARGHEVTHSSCAAHVSGKGSLAAQPGESLTFEVVGEGQVVDKLAFGKRLLQELRFGRDVAREARRLQAEVVLASNMPIPALFVLAIHLLVARIPWVLWHQDVHSQAMRSFAGEKLSRSFVAIAAVMAWLERWSARRSAAIVVIADSFVEVHRRWRTASKVSVIPNWAPLDELRPVARDNAWAREQGVAGTRTLVYSGTLGLKHNPALLVELAREVIDGGQPVHLVVVSEGPAMEVIAAEAERLDVPVTLLPFQPYERLPEVLGSGDVLVVLLDQSAGAFSVPSKTLSYLCAGRPVLGLMPAENLAAALIEQVHCQVLPPSSQSIPEAAAWVRKVVADPALAQDLGARARALAEREFSLEGCTDAFETILARAAGTTLAVPPHAVRPEAGAAEDLDVEQDAELALPTIAQEIRRAGIPAHTSPGPVEVTSTAFAPTVVPAPTTSPE